MTPALAEDLLDVLAVRKRDALGRGTGEVGPWLFCSLTGGPALEPRNVERSRHHLLKHRNKRGRIGRPPELHCTRHTWATLALRAGESVRWVADVLGHADPPFTPRVYAHAPREEEHDLGLLAFGAPGRPLASTTCGNRKNGPTKSLTIS